MPAVRSRFLVRLPSRSARDARRLNSVGGPGGHVINRARPCLDPGGVGQHGQPFRGRRPQKAEANDSADRLPAVVDIGSR